MTTGAPTRSVIVERDIPQPTAKVWKALTQSHLIAEWLMNNDFDLKVGHRFQLRGEWGGVLDCEVLAVDPGNSLSYAWNHVHDDPLYSLTSVVTYTLTPTDTGTRLRMEQIGFRPEQKQAYGGAHAGWKGFLDRLEQLVAGRI